MTGSTMPISPPINTAHSALVGSSPTPFANRSAMAFHALAAGIGNCLLSFSTLGASAYQAGTIATVPKKMPANCARNCRRGFAPNK